MFDDSLMQRGLLAAGLAAGLSVFIPSPQASAQQDFCSALKAVIGDAGNQFKTVRSKRMKGFWRVHVEIPGMMGCQMEDFPTFLYTCVDDAPDRKAAENRIGELERAVAACMPELKAERSKSKAGLPKTIYELPQTDGADLLLSLSPSHGRFMVKVSVDAGLPF